MKYCKVVYVYIDGYIDMLAYKVTYQSRIPLCYVMDGSYSPECETPSIVFVLYILDMFVSK
jgi:hypothetical protein